MSTIPSFRNSLFLASLTFSLFLIFGYVSDLLQMRHPNWIVADDVMMAGAAAVLVFRYERERSRFLSENCASSVT
ncbi:MAG TPA: hypothetical protein VFE61_26075 [Candidatus Sulfotelmatobacter sp.]|jgi:hypothetical protein|nr:hypothetical protein [Candidatus Sulfotelmatobacter sp.]